MSKAALVLIVLAELAAADFLAAEQQIRAQITVESAWRHDVCSPYACGLTQFTLPTWQDISPLTRPSCEGIDRFDPACATRAQIVYMRRLLKRYEYASTSRDRWMFSWAAYNGGPGWINRESKRCKRVHKCDPSRWEGNVEKFCIRANWACNENRAYPYKVLSHIK